MNDSGNLHQKNENINIHKAKLFIKRSDYEKYLKKIQSNCNI